jgi:hypothetical protein
MKTYYFFPPGGGYGMHYIVIESSLEKAKEKVNKKLKEEWDDDDIEWLHHRVLKTGEVIAIEFC